jgi:hypothetical protein
MFYYKAHYPSQFYWSLNKLAKKFTAEEKITKNHFLSG